MTGYDQIIASLKSAPRLIRRYMRCKAAGHVWEPYKPVKGKPYLVRRCSRCKVTQVNTR